MKHFTYVGEMTVEYRILIGDPLEKDHLGKFGVSWEDNIKMDLKEMLFKMWTGIIWLRTESSGEHCVEPPGYIKPQNFLSN
jgi:hypothetical protein